ncbi:hypothetical protein JCM6882_001104 [Rhodosporidiobolus microsporus]
MSLVPSHDLYQRTVRAARVATDHDPIFAPLFPDISPSEWDRLSSSEKYLRYARLVQTIAPYVGAKYLAHGTSHHTPEQLWLGTVQQFASLYSRDHNASAPYVEVLALVQSWDPRARGEALTEGETQKLRLLAGLLRAMSEARCRLPSVEELMGHHRSLTTRKARCYGYASGGAQY